MKHKSGTRRERSEKAIKDIRRAARKRYSAEDKIRIVLDGLRGDHGVPGGENMLAGRSGFVRYFAIREMARLQGFPDDFNISGSWKAATRQLGNAVPTSVGKCMGAAVMTLISDIQTS